MNDYNSLFESTPFLSPLNPEEASEIQKWLHLLTYSHKRLPGFPLPKKITDQMILVFFKALQEGHAQINTLAWTQFLEQLFMNGLMEQLHSPSLKKYLLIQLAKKKPLSRFIELNERKKLAYNALHGGKEARSILLSHAKHFELNDPPLLADIAYKGILLGGACDIDLLQFMPLSFEQAKQLIFLIGKIDPKKAHLELSKLTHFFPEAKTEITPHLRAS